MRGADSSESLQYVYAPDYVEQRGENHLLVCEADARWAVVDEEMCNLICRTKRELSSSGESSQQERRSEPAIRNTALNITRQCNLRCSFCYSSDVLTNSSENELSAAEIVLFLKNAKRLAASKPSFVILGGEPLL